MSEFMVLFLGTIMIMLVGWAFVEGLFKMIFRDGDDDYMDEMYNKDVPPRKEEE